jgi:hypothetical protein
MKRSRSCLDIQQLAVPKRNRSTPNLASRGRALEGSLTVKPPHFSTLLSQVSCCSACCHDIHHQCSAAHSAQERLLQHLRKVQVEVGVRLCWWCKHQCADGASHCYLLYSQRPEVSQRAAVSSGSSGSATVRRITSSELLLGLQNMQIHQRSRSAGTAPCSAQCSSSASNSGMQHQRSLNSFTILEHPYENCADDESVCRTRYSSSGAHCGASTDDLTAGNSSLHMSREQSFVSTSTAADCWADEALCSQQQLQRQQDADDMLLWGESCEDIGLCIDTTSSEDDGEGDASDDLHEELHQSSCSTAAHQLVLPIVAPLVVQLATQQPLQQQYAAAAGTDSAVCERPCAAEHRAAAAIEVNSSPKATAAR